MANNNNNNTTKTKYILYIDAILLNEDDEVSGRSLVPVAYYAHNKDEAIEEAHKVAAAMARGIEAEGEGYDFYYSVRCDREVCYMD